MKGKPVLGALAGLLLGLFVAVDLQQFGIRPLDNLSVIGFPLVGLIVGLLVAAAAPFGTKASAGSTGQKGPGADGSV